jgi:hypothetical protein
MTSLTPANDTSDSNNIMTDKLKWNSNHINNNLLLAIRWRWIMLGLLVFVWTTLPLNARWLNQCELHTLWNVLDQAV